MTGAARIPVGLVDDVDNAVDCAGTVRRLAGYVGRYTAASGGAGDAALRSVILMVVDELENSLGKAKRQCDGLHTAQDPSARVVKIAARRRPLH